MFAIFHTPRSHKAFYCLYFPLSFHMSKIHQIIVFIILFLALIERTIEGPKDVLTFNLPQLLIFVQS